MDKKKIIGKNVAVQLFNGTKIFGTLEKWTEDIVWVKERGDYVDSLDIPKEIIERILVVFEGGKE